MGQGAIATIQSPETKNIAKGLSDKGILVEKEAESMRKMAGYRNRMVHFYHEVTPEELHEICLYHVNEIKFLADKPVQWAKEHQDKGDKLNKDTEVSFTFRFAF